MNFLLQFLPQLLKRLIHRTDHQTKISATTFPSLVFQPLLLQLKKLLKLPFNCSQKKRLTSLACRFGLSKKLLMKYLSPFTTFLRDLLSKGLYQSNLNQPRLFLYLKMVKKMQWTITGLSPYLVATLKLLKKLYVLVLHVFLTLTI